MKPHPEPFDLGAMLARMLRLSGWLAVNALTAAGIVALAFFALGDFSLPLTMAQLANLADRYVIASAVRQGQFNHLVLYAFAAAFAAVAFSRRAGFARALGVSPHVHE